mmetsp:Transcript_18125/g.58737  ORF Transcript_18125/g.58737 Transcript_18125/m.58737 type:complete len:108 (+) Transcript_18125:206-529(+)
MSPAMKECTTSLTEGRPQMSIGSEASNTLRIKGATVSRTHAVVELEQRKGAVYVCDMSTNGTFLNGRRLPPKASGKVMLSHGDELLFQDPTAPGGHEFGYMVNIEMS